MPDPAPLHITTRSGRVRVVAAPGAELVVEGGTVERRDDGTIHIRREQSSTSVDVRCAAGVDVIVGTGSGTVDLSGAFGAVRVTTVSGRIRVAEATRVDVRTTSGKIEIGTCAECRVTTKSSAVRVRRADSATIAAVSGVVLLEDVRGAEVTSVSGKVVIGSSGGERLAVHTVSGKVEIRVPAATKPATRLHSRSGNVLCDVTPGDDFDISVNSVSGAIRVSTA